MEWVFTSTLITARARQASCRAKATGAPFFKFDTQLNLASANSQLAQTRAEEIEVLFHLNQGMIMPLQTQLTSNSNLQQSRFKFVGKQAIAKLTGLSEETLKKYRLGGVWTYGTEHIYWIRLNSRTVRYNYELISDWMQNCHDPMAHQRAIDFYLASFAF